MPDPYRTVTAAVGRTRTTRVLVTAVFLAAVAAFESVGFRLSYEALHRVAVDNAVPEHSAWMFPVLVDGGIVLGSIGVVRALSAHRHTRPYWTVTVGFTLVSWGFNVSNAPRTAGGWAVATVAPLAQMVALEMGMQELRALLLQQSQAASASVPAPSAVPASAPAEEAAPEPETAPTPEAETAPAPAPEAAPTAAQDSADQHADDDEQQQEQQETTTSEDGQQRQQRQQRQRPPLQPDGSRPWAVLYEKCSTEEERIALTRDALSARKKLTAPQWAVDIRKGDTRARDLLRAARKTSADVERQAQLELLSA